MCDSISSEHDDAITRGAHDHVHVRIVAIRSPLGRQDFSQNAEVTSISKELLPGFVLFSSQLQNRKHRLPPSVMKVVCPVGLSLPCSRQLNRANTSRLKSLLNQVHGDVKGSHFSKQRMPSFMTPPFNVHGVVRLMCTTYAAAHSHLVMFRDLVWIHGFFSGRRTRNTSFRMSPMTLSSVFSHGCARSHVFPPCVVETKLYVEYSTIDKMVKLC